MSLDDVQFLEKHQAVVHFRTGYRIGIELTREDGLKVQCSDWTLATAMDRARKLARGERG